PRPRCRWCRSCRWVPQPEWTGAEAAAAMDAAGMSVEVRAQNVQRARAHLSATVTVAVDGAAVAAETVLLDVPEERAGLVDVVRSRLNGRGRLADELEPKLLDLLGQALDGLAEDEGPRASQADKLVEIAAAADLFHDPAGDTYARPAIGDHHETWPTRSKGFRRWLVGAFYQRHQKAPGSQAVSDALNVVESRAQFDGACATVYLRVAPDRMGGLYLDLGGPDWRAARVTPTGWS